MAATKGMPATTRQKVEEHMKIHERRPRMRPECLDWERQGFDTGQDE